MSGMSLVFLPTRRIRLRDGWRCSRTRASCRSNMTVEEGVKLIVSGGLVRPPGPGAGD